MGCRGEAEDERCVGMGGDFSRERFCSCCFCNGDSVVGARVGLDWSTSAAGSWRDVARTGAGWGIARGSWSCEIDGGACNHGCDEGGE